MVKIFIFSIDEKILEKNRFLISRKPIQSKFIFINDWFIYISFELWKYKFSIS